ncbi:39S ribosomal protein L53/MRP-L53-domain-containing protein [Aspergillus taichungensis]|uniref:Large ribosomal subunit protein mL53 n=1 Tax=Aspergillus taichungensis TaxID=482145 RepID=A0A2J5HXZ5_9EURO|nr:39S ribosomal protein L53/MRP-L53-domain-containing protein [Aspergillus taichungensis]
MSIPLQTINSFRVSYNPFGRSSRPCRTLLALLRTPSTTPLSSPTHIDIKVKQLPRHSTQQPEVTVGFKGGKEVKFEVGKEQIKIADMVNEIARIGRIIEREDTLKG